MGEYIHFDDTTNTHMAEMLFILATGRTRSEIMNDYVAPQPPDVSRPYRGGTGSDMNIVDPRSFKEFDYALRTAKLFARVMEILRKPDETRRCTVEAKEISAKFLSEALSGYTFEYSRTAGERVVITEKLTQYVGEVNKAVDAHLDANLPIRTSAVSPGRFQA